jgi:hypothetical protein
MALTVKEVKAGPRHPSGGYETTVTTQAGGVGELAGERVVARELIPGLVPKQWDGHKVPAPPKKTTDPALDSVPRVITS